VELFQCLFIFLMGQLIVFVLNDFVEKCIAVFCFVCILHEVVYLGVIIVFPLLFD